MSIRRAGRSRAGFSALETVMVLICLAVFLSVATIVYQRHQDTIHQRVCFTQQRTIQGSIESLPAGDVDVPVDELFAQLVSAGLIPGQLSGPRSVESVNLADPGYGPGSFRNYMVMPGSKMVGCRNHGSPFADF